jgi:hypothetical protein
MYFTDLLDDLIANLDNDSCVIEQLKEIGRKHTALAVHESGGIFKKM